jgi:hypothetical protein
LKTESGRREVARPPLPQARYFQNGPYAGDRDHTRWPENFLAWLTHHRIRLRGARENLYFVDKRKLKQGLRFGPETLPPPWRRWTRPGAGPASTPGPRRDKA